VFGTFWNIFIVTVTISLGLLTRGPLEDSWTIGPGVSWTFCVFQVPDVAPIHSPNRSVGGFVANSADLETDQVN